MAIVHLMAGFERDEYFFHYTTREAAFRHILKPKKLRFSRYLDMRDPLENKVWSFMGGGWGDDEAAQNEAYFKFHYLANEIRRRAYLLSLTIDAPRGSGETDPFNRGWARARMWEQYAENHAGVCLVFSRALLTQEIIESLERQELSPPYYKPVSYNGDPDRLPFLHLDDLAGKVDPEVVAEYIEKNNEQLFFEKTLDWAAEYEYRFVFTAPPGPEESDSDITGRGPLHVHYREALQAVIVGEAFPKWQRPGAISACEEAGIKHLRLDWSMRRPILVELRPVSSRRDEIRESIGRHGPPAADSPPQ